MIENLEKRNEILENLILYIREKGEERYYHSVFMNQFIRNIKQVQLDFDKPIELITTTDWTMYFNNTIHYSFGFQSKMQGMLDYYLMALEDNEIIEKGLYKNNIKNVVNSKIKNDTKYEKYYYKNFESFISFMNSVSKLRLPFDKNELNVFLPVMAIMTYRGFSYDEIYESNISDVDLPNKTIRCINKTIKIRDEEIEFYERAMKRHEDKINLIRRTGINVDGETQEKWLSFLFYNKEDKDGSLVVANSLYYWINHANTFFKNINIFERWYGQKINMMYIRSSGYNERIKIRMERDAQINFDNVEDRLKHPTKDIFKYGSKYVNWFPGSVKKYDYIGWLNFFYYSDFGK